MYFDDILLRIGEFGFYQKRFIWLATLAAIPVAFNNVGSIFLAASMDHWCAFPDADNCTGPIAQRNDTLCETSKLSNIPHTYDGKKITFQQCSRYSISSFDAQNDSSMNGSNDTMTCDQGWAYDTSQYKSSIISEFDLVCERKSLVGYSSSIYFAGFMIGSMFCGMTADRIGRFPTFLICVGMTSLIGTITAFAQSYVAFVTLRFFLAIFNIGMLIMVFVIGTEVTGPAQRVIPTIFLAQTFGIGIMIYALLAYFIRDWRSLQLAISLPTLLSFSLVIIMHESARWLFTRGKHDRAQTVVRKIAAVNRTEVPEEMLVQGIEKSQSEDSRTYTPLDLFRTPWMRKKTIIIICNWFVVNMVYYGLSLSTSGLGVDDYVACFLSGLVEIPANFTCWFAIQKLGRPLVHCIYMIIGGVACIVTTMIPMGVARTVVAMIGKFGITGAFTVIYIYSGELYPTVVRSIGMGTSSMSARVSGILSPIILMLQTVWKPLPFIIFGICSIVAGLLSLILPETLNTHLPETLQDGEEFGKNDKCKWMLCCKRTRSDKDSIKYIKPPQGAYEKVVTEANAV